MFQLKSYQQRAIDCLESFLLNCQILPSVEDAYSQTLAEQSLPELGYRDYGFEQTPYVCMRIPTGGGKTILGSYAVDIAARKYVGLTHRLRFGSCQPTQYGCKRLKH